MNLIDMKNIRDIKAALNRKALHSYRFTLWEIAEDFSISHMRREQAIGIISSFLNSHPEYVAIIGTSSNSSVFTSCEFVHKEKGLKGHRRILVNSDLSS